MARTQQQFTAGTRMIRITELLEKILLHLNQRDLLRLQQVVQIKAVTEGSIQLQRKLFFKFEKPDGSLPHMSEAIFGGPDPFINKLTPILAGPEYSMSLALQPGKTMPSFFAFGYKLLLTFQHGNFYRGEDGTHVEMVFRGVSVENREHAVEMGVLRKKPISEAVREGSWRKMLLIQPLSKITWRVEMKHYGPYTGELPGRTILEDLVTEGRVRGW